jgi:hypothetical protein
MSSSPADELSTWTTVAREQDAKRLRTPFGPTEFMEDGNSQLMLFQLSYSPSLSLQGSLSRFGPTSAS